MRSLTKSILRAVGGLLGHFPGVFDLLIDRVACRINLDRGFQTSKYFHTKIALDLADYTQRKAYFRCFERRELRFLKKVLSPGMIVLDVGANVGLISIPIAHQVGETGRVICFEPVPSNFGRLIANTNGFKQVTAVNFACGISSEVALSRVPGVGDRSATSGSFSKFGSGLDLTHVPCIRIDSFITKGFSNAIINLVKIDVQDDELSVILSCADLIKTRRIRKFLIEAVIDRDTGFRSSDLEVMQLLETSGYLVRPIGFSGDLLEDSITEYSISRHRYPYWALKVSPAICINYAAVLLDQESL